jgi:hypothetical protein
MQRLNSIKIRKDDLATQWGGRIEVAKDVVCGMKVDEATAQWKSEMGSNSGGHRDARDDS